ncbi:hypothetical protein HZH66_011902 [Vespula vulgaris]|uniref:Uncharacterized protein n=1 Tax=Vespula vulgaris TaxID=7454 RepID=A0A834MVJ4_VESVU|nr:hypothetical protein HZH66_011902 [Vespula vulgaris]
MGNVRRTLRKCEEKDKNHIKWNKKISGRVRTCKKNFKGQNPTKRKVPKEEEENEEEEEEEEEKEKERRTGDRMVGDLPSFFIR